MSSKTFNRSATLDRKTPLKALSFFSGCMGLELGLEQEGIEILLACEIDRAAQRTIKFNRPDIALIEDITKYSAVEIRNKAGLSSSEEIDLIVGSPPCQVFSIAGTKQESNGRDNLFPTFIDLIAKLRPKFAVIETCPGLLRPLLRDEPNSIEKVSQPNLGQEKQISVRFSYIIRRLKVAGYSVSFDLYNAADFGSPQVRKRIIITCSLDGKELPYLTPTHTNSALSELPEWQTLKDAIEGISDDEHHFRKLPERSLRYYRHLKPGQNWQNLQMDLQQEIHQRFSPEYISRKADLYRRLAWDSPSPTFFYNKTKNFVHPEADRWLSIEECKRIQDFPDDWRIYGDLYDQYRQIGNATPCSLGRAIAKMLLTYLGQEGSISYVKKIENIFKSIETLGGWEKEVHSFNPLSQYEKYFQIATSKYLTLNHIENEIEVTCDSGRIDIAVESMNMIIEFKGTFNRDNLEKGVAQLDRYAKSTGMNRKVPDRFVS